MPKQPNWPNRLADVPKSQREADKHRVSYWYTMGDLEVFKGNKVSKVLTNVLFHHTNDCVPQGRAIGRFSPKFPDESQAEMASRFWLDVPDHVPAPRHEKQAQETRFRPLPPETQIESLREDQRMKVEHTDAVQLLKALGFAGAESWGHRRMADKLEALNDLSEKEKEAHKRKVADKDLRNLMEAVLTTLEEDRGVVVVDDVVEKDETYIIKAMRVTAKSETDGDEYVLESEEGGYPYPDPAAKVTAPKKGKVPPVRKSARAKMDALGAEEGSLESCVNAAFLGSPKGTSLSVKDVVEMGKECDLDLAPRFVKSHLDKMVVGGKMTVKGGKYALKVAKKPVKV